MILIYSLLTAIISICNCSNFIVLFLHWSWKHKAGREYYDYDYVVSTVRVGPGGVKMSGVKVGGSTSTIEVWVYEYNSGVENSSNSRARTCTYEHIRASRIRKWRFCRDFGNLERL